MKREDAIEYLQRKGEIRGCTKIIEQKIVTMPAKKKIKKVKTYKNPKWTAEEKDKIGGVMKKGKIYGDPVVVLNE